MVRSGGAAWCTIYLPHRGITEAEGWRPGEAAPAGGESQTGGGASQSSLPAAGSRDGGAIPHRALHAAAATAGGHRHSDPLQVITTISTYGTHFYVLRSRQSKHTANCPYMDNDKVICFYRTNVKHRELMVKYRYIFSEFERLQQYTF